jgi:hypothetical protein
MHTFTHDPICQKLVRNVSHELWHRGYACRVCFYEEREADEATFCDSIFAEHPDSIIWLTPSPRMTILGHRLLNCGIRVIKAAAVAEALIGVLS